MLRVAKLWALFFCEPYPPVELINILF